LLPETNAMPPIDATRARAFEIIKAKSFVRGRITLASGKESDHYFDMKPSMMDAEGAHLLAQLLLAEVQKVEADYVGGLEMGAVPLIAPISALSWVGGRRIDGFFVRKAPKEHGTQKLIEGVKDLSGRNAAIVEDVTTTGGSAMKAIQVLQNAGAKITLVVSILDREEGAVALYRDAGIPFTSLFKASAFLKD
jgi:orotate phosphoribosyltransferase